MFLAAVRSKAVVLLLLINCLLLLPLSGFCVWSLSCYAFLGVLPSVAGERAGCCTFVVFLMSRDCSVVLPHGAVGKSAVCDCGIS